MNRIQSGLINAPRSAFDPLAIARAGDRTAAGIGQVADALQQKAAKERAIGLDAARKTTALESARVEREIAADLDGVSQNLDETGKGYKDAGMKALQRRQSEAISRVSDDPLKVEALTERFELEKEAYQGSLEATERAHRKNYEVGQTVLEVDDASQEVAQQTYSAPFDPQEDVLPGLRSHGDHIASKIRNKPLSKDYQQKLSGIVRGALGSGYDVRIVSGGQDRKEFGTRRTGSTRHDVDHTGHSHTSDLTLVKNGKPVKPADDPAAYAKLIEAAAGTFPGIGHYEWGLHIGGGSPAFWGPDKTGKTADANFKAAYERGKKNPKEYASGVDEYGVPIYTGPRIDLKKDPIVADRVSRVHEMIDGRSIPAWQKAELKRKAETQIYSAAMDSLTQQNPSAALDVVRSGVLDDVLSYGFTEGIERSALSDLQAQLRRKIAAVAKSQETALKNDANLAADDFLAFERGGRIGDAPPDLSKEQFDLLPRETQQAVTAAPHIADAVALAQNAPVSDLASIRATLEPGGEGYDVELQAANAFDEAAMVRRLQEAEKLTMLERQSLISQIGDKKPEDRRFREALLGQQSRFRSGLKDDQVGLIRDAGGKVNDITSENFIADLEERFASVSGFAERNGVPPVLMSPEERLAFTEQFNEMTLPEKMGVMAEVAASPNLSDTFFSEISDVAPFLSHAGGMLVNGGDRGAVSMAMKGYQAGVDGVKFDGISQADKSQLMGGGLAEALRGMPAVLSDMQKFADNYANGKSLEAGGVVDIDDYEEGLSVGLPEVYKYKRGRISRTRPMILPPNTDASAMTAFFDSMGDFQLRDSNGGKLPVDAEGVEIDAEYIRANADYTTVGPGQYVIEFEDGAALDQNGRPFILKYTDPYAGMDVKFKGSSK